MDHEETTFPRLKQFPRPLLEIALQEAESCFLSLAQGDALRIAEGRCQYQDGLLQVRLAKSAPELAPLDQAQIAFQAEVPAKLRQDFQLQCVAGYGMVRLSRPGLILIQVLELAGR